MNQKEEVGQDLTLLNPNLNMTTTEVLSLEKAVEDQQDLSSIPIIPLYFQVNEADVGTIVKALPLMDKNQRCALRDIDCWKKDLLDLSAIESWVHIYSQCEDFEIQQEFSVSGDFLLFLKQRFQVYTFDPEFPIYPDNDNYFLTEDNAFLFEYHSSLGVAAQTKFLLKQFYAELGVEKAHMMILELINELATNSTEEKYQEKTNRLSDYGILSYFQTLELTSPFVNMMSLKRYITQRKKLMTPRLDEELKKQYMAPKLQKILSTVHQNIFEQLKSLEDEERKNYIQFSLIQLINSLLVNEGYLNDGNISLHRKLKFVLSTINLGHSYLLANKSLYLNEEENEAVLSHFDFKDLFKIGQGLLMINKGQLKKALTNNGFEDLATESFLGDKLVQFLENTFEEYPKFNDIKDGKAKIIDSYELYAQWTSISEHLIQLIPFIKKFYDTFEKLKQTGQLRDEFYYNYGIDEIDFETILLSSFFNFMLGHYKNYPQDKKMGLTIAEFLQVVDQIGQYKEKNWFINGFDEVSLSKSLTQFSEAFGLDKIVLINEYLYEILRNHLNDYDFNHLSQSDWKHVGGPLLLNIQ